MLLLQLCHGHSLEGCVHACSGCARVGVSECGVGARGPACFSLRPSMFQHVRPSMFQHVRPSMFQHVRPSMFQSVPCIHLCAPPPPLLHGPVGPGKPTASYGHPKTTPASAETVLQPCDKAAVALRRCYAATTPPLHFCSSAPTLQHRSLPCSAGAEC